MNISTLVDRLALVPALVLALGAPSNVVAAIGGGTVYVDAVNGSDRGSGTAGSPWQTITHAIAESDVAGTTISVAAGTYDEALGEEFPLVLTAASLDGNGAGLERPHIQAPEANDGNNSPILEIANDEDGPVSVDGLSFSYLNNTNPNKDLIRVYPRSEFTLNDCELIGGKNGITIYGDLDGAQLSLTNNTVSGSWDDGLKCNAYSGTGLSVLVTGNSITGAGRHGIDLYFSVADDSETMSGTILIDGNTISGSFYEAIELDMAMTHSDNMTLDFDATISNNTISDGEDDGMRLDFSIDSSEDNLFDIALLVNDNTITTTGIDGIWANIYMESTANVASVDWVFRNNSISGAGDDGLDVYLRVSDSHSIMGAEVLIEGNTVIDSGDNGMEVSVSMDAYTSATLEVYMVIKNNTVEGSGSNGMEIEMPSVAFGSSSLVDIDLVINENTITGSGNFGVTLAIGESYTSSAMGGVLYTLYEVVMTNNTIVGNDTDAKMFAPGGTSTSTSGTGQVSIEGAYDILASMDGTGNWWGTQNQSKIADLVWDGVELGADYTVLDHTSGRPTALSFDVTVNGTEFTLDATSLTRFVSYAGADQIAITVDGTVVPAGDILTLGSDSITGTLPSGITGSVDFCVTNPAGQTGCSQGTIDGGVNTAPPVAIYDVTTTPNGTAVTIDLVANDTDVDGNLDPTTVVITQQPGQGTVVNNGDGTATYTPNAATASDTFNYTVSDTEGLTSNNATVQVSTTGGGSNNNTIPTAVYDHVNMNGEVSILIDVLANDWDADMDALDADSLVIRRQPRDGTATVVNGQIEFTPDADSLSGNSVFTYRVRDEHGALSNTATIAVWH